MDGTHITLEEFNELHEMGFDDSNLEPVHAIGINDLFVYSKEVLHEYLTNSFATLFFTENKFAQDKMRIVGPVRLRTIHTLKKEECSFATQLSACHYASMRDKNLFKEDIDGIKF